MRRFCTAINCMDGRVQVPVIQYLKGRFSADYVDIVSEPGPVRIIADGSDAALIKSIERRVKISVEHHRSVGIAVVGHFDCAGNPSPEAKQKKQTAETIRRLRRRFTQVPVIGLWVDKNFRVSEVSSN